MCVMYEVFKEYMYYTVYLESYLYIFVYDFHVMVDVCGCVICFSKMLCKSGFSGRVCIFEVVFCMVYAEFIAL